MYVWTWFFLGGGAYRGHTLSTGDACWEHPIRRSFSDNGATAAPVWNKKQCCFEMLGLLCVICPAGSPPPKKGLIIYFELYPHPEWFTSYLLLTTVFKTVVKHAWDRQTLSFTVACFLQYENKDNFSKQLERNSSQLADTGGSWLRQ